jgi:3-hydroxybutyryl-CoA dehydratase
MTVQVGDALPELTVVVDPERMKTMAALLRDPNMIHLDPLVSAGLGFGERVVNQGPINLGYLQTVLAGWAGGADRVLASRFRFAHPVFGGDRVVAGGRVTAVSTGEGTAECALWLDVVRPDERVRAVSGTATVAIDTVAVDQSGAP